MRRKSKPSVATAPAEAWKFPGLLKAEGSDADRLSPEELARYYSPPTEPHPKTIERIRKREEAEELERKRKEMLSFMEQRLLQELRKGSLPEGARGTYRKALAAVRKGDHDGAISIIEEASAKT